MNLEVPSGVNRELVPKLHQSNISTRSSKEKISRLSDVISSKENKNHFQGTLPILLELNPLNQRESVQRLSYKIRAVINFEADFWLYISISDKYMIKELNMPDVPYWEYGCDAHFSWIHWFHEHSEVSHTPTLKHRCTYGSRLLPERNHVGKTPLLQIHWTKIWPNSGKYKPKKFSL